jgi:hypothetical protein
MQPPLIAALVAVLPLCAYASAPMMPSKELSWTDLHEHSATLIGQRVSVFGSIERRYDGRREKDIWLSAVARAHEFGPERSDFCVRAVDRTGKLAEFKDFTLVRASGELHSDPIPKPTAMECPSALVLSVDQVQAVAEPR